MELAVMVVLAALIALPFLGGGSSTHPEFTDEERRAVGPTMERVRLQREETLRQMRDPNATFYELDIPD